MINALFTSVRKAGSTDSPNESFSTLRSGWIGNAYTSTSSRTAYAASEIQNELTVRLSGAASPSAITFDGTGTVFIDGRQLNLQGGQFSVAEDPMPMDRTLHEWREPGTNHTVRLFLGSLPEKPDLMRLCLRIEVPGALRVACSRHLRRDGSLVAADILHDVNGTQFAHVNNDDERNPRSVLRCVRSELEFTTDGDPVRRESTTHSMFVFDDPRFFRNWAVSHDRSAMPESWTETATEAGVQYEYGPPFVHAGFRWTVRDRTVVQYAGGAARFFSEQCDPLR